ncbi:hypothetical protein METHB2_470029 [Candidatus Methylobacter favarea]|uniref:Uncharacterized protein n=1 Tax=Candidatus Methylobacter favarea TaxID=2707345 RepID=A0A8S0YAD7_9GAMM|nr:hypothetical protein METHB2_470029 [Candidatus Methylobacter favarea]
MSTLFRAQRIKLFSYAIDKQVAANSQKQKRSLPFYFGT